MLSLREAMDRLFEESVVGPRWHPMWPSSEGAPLAIDMYQTDDAVVVSAATPGVTPEDIEIMVTGDTLTIKGETRFEEKVEKENYIRQERRYGRFERQLSLPVEVESDKAEALFENGVLTLTLPKAEAVKPKSIKINVK
jgi:HSP20 family protein